MIETVKRHTALVLALSTCLACTGQEGGPSSAAPAPVAVDSRYAEVVETLSTFIERELADKEIPGLSIALVDDQDLVWAAGFGYADPEAGVAATAETLYRVGSVSKLFTDLGIMQLVEQGRVDLDAPVTDYLPDFAPTNPFDRDITLRQLMSHRSGLVREPPVGHYFDDSEPTLEATVASLNDTRLVYEPESRIKYSNAAIATVGYVLEVLSGEPFTDNLQRAVLEPIGMSSSAFAPNDAIRSRLAKAVMWSYDGREFPAPTWELGMAPAGSMYAPVTDLAKFMKVLFANGVGPNGPVLQPETLAEMFTPQFAEEGDEGGFGIGFSIGELDGHRSYGHGGAIYGFATTFEVLPDEKIGAVAVANMDVVNSVTSRVVEQALRLMLAQRAGETLRVPAPSEPLDPSRAESFEGRWAADDLSVDLWSFRDEAVLETGRSRYRVRARGDSLLLEGRLIDGYELVPTETPGLLLDGELELLSVETPEPPPAPERFLGLLGEYGWDYNVLFVYEKGGQLHALVEWTEINPMLEVDGASQPTFDFPDGRLYHGEQLIFRLNEDGRATEAVLADIVFPRREIQGESAETFVIEPVRPVEELRAEALAATPPEESGDFVDPDLVDLADLDPSLRFDIRYATTNNFMQARFYDQPRAFMQRPAAEALVRAHRALEPHGYGLLIHDAYRPWYVTKMFFDATPEEHKHFVADPAHGSRHNRGCAVDLTLFDRETGEPVETVGLYDEFSERSYPEYMGGTEQQRWRRELLRDVMEAEGFRVYEYEWWHFDFDGWERYPIGNAVFEDL